MVKSMKLNERALALSAAAVSAATMLLLGVFGNFGMYPGAVQMMGEMHMFFALSPVGIIAGMIEAAIISFIFIYVFAVIYNKLI